MDYQPPPPGLPNTVYVVYVYLADDEWSTQEGGRLMDNLAQQVFRLPNLAAYRPLQVVVVEHGGWALSYGLRSDIGVPDLNSTPLCVGSANDCATFHGLAETWRKKFYTYDRRLLADIRRPNQPQEQPLVQSPEPGSTP